MNELLMAVYEWLTGEKSENQQDNYTMSPELAEEVSLTL